MSKTHPYLCEGIFSFIHDTSSPEEVRRGLIKALKRQGIEEQGFEIKITRMDVGGAIVPPNPPAPEPPVKEKEIKVKRVADGKNTSKRKVSPVRKKDKPRRKSNTSRKSRSSKMGDKIRKHHV